MEKTNKNRQENSETKQAKKKKKKLKKGRKEGRKEEKAIRGTSHTRCETYHKAFIIKQWGMDT